MMRLWLGMLVFAPSCTALVSLESETRGTRMPSDATVDSAVDRSDGNSTDKDGGISPKDAVVDSVADAVLDAMAPPICTTPLGKSALACEDYDTAPTVNWFPINANNGATFVEQAGIGFQGSKAAEVLLPMLPAGTNASAFRAFSLPSKVNVTLEFDGIIEMASAAGSGDSVDVAMIQFRQNAGSDTSSFLWKLEANGNLRFQEVEDVGGARTYKSIVLTSSFLEGQWHHFKMSLDLSANRAGTATLDSTSLPFQFQALAAKRDVMVSYSGSTYSVSTTGQTRVKVDNFTLREN